MALGALYHFLLSLLVYLALLASLGFLSIHWLILPVVLFPFLLACCSPEKNSRGNLKKRLIVNRI
jgi:ABC-type polysaccharide/polyol phosphate export permease